MEEYFCFNCGSKLAVLYNQLAKVEVKEKPTIVAMSKKTGSPQYVKCYKCGYSSSFKEYRNHKIANELGSLSLVKKLESSPFSINQEDVKHIPDENLEKLIVELETSIEISSLLELAKVLHPAGKKSAFNAVCKRMNSYIEDPEFIELLADLYLFNSKYLAELILNTIPLDIAYILPGIVKLASEVNVESFLSTLLQKSKLSPSSEEMYNIVRYSLIESFKRSLSVSKMILETFQPSFSDRRLSGLVHAAIACSSTSVLQIMIEKNFPIRGVDCAIASRRGSYECCKLLIENSQVNLENFNMTQVADLMYGLGIILFTTNPVTLKECIEQMIHEICRCGTKDKSLKLRDL